MSETPERPTRQLREGEAFWYCKSCNSILGAVYQGDLDLRIPSVNMVRTLNGKMLARCRKCGTVKTWFFDPEVAIASAIQSISKSVTEDHVARMRVLLQEMDNNIQAAIQGAAAIIVGQMGANDAKQGDIRDSGTRNGNMEIDAEHSSRHRLPSD